MAKKRTGRESGADTIIRAFADQGACSLWQADVKLLNGKHRLEMIRLGKSIVLVQDYPNGDGWNVFVPASQDGRIDETITAIAKHCGVDEPTQSELPR